MLVDAAAWKRTLNRLTMVELILHGYIIYWKNVTFIIIIILTVWEKSNWHCE